MKQPWYRFLWVTVLGTAVVAHAMVMLQKGCLIDGIGYLHEFNVVEWIIGLAATVFVLERFRALLTHKFQWRLSSLFLLVVVAALWSMTLSDPDWGYVELKFPVYVYLPYYFVELSLVYAFVWLVTRLVGWCFRFVSRCFRPSATE